MLVRNFRRHYLQVISYLTASCVICICKRMATYSECDTGDNPPNVVRLSALSGYDSRKNDVIVCKHQSPTVESRVVFFGGDSQDYPENMSAHRDNHRFLQWNLVNVADMLGKKFINSDIFVVKPSRMQFKTFSCYDNFIVANNVGVPTHVPNNKAIIHLKSLLSNAVKAVGLETPRPGECVVPLPIILIGFSKGCVVLNQIVYELQLMDADPEVKSFVKLITDIYWLDGGHPGGSNLWITKSELLQRLVDLGIRIHVFVTPYQIKDQSRPWLGKEEKLFSDMLKKRNAKIERKILFEHEPRDILFHFRVIEEI